MCNKELSAKDLQLIDTALSTLKNKAKKCVRQSNKRDDDKGLFFKLLAEQTIQQIDNLKNKLQQ